MKATLLYIVDPETQEVLMAKKCKKVGVGFWFGYGGKLEDEDAGDMKRCIVREFETESGGVSIDHYYDQLEPMAFIRFFRGEDKDPLKDEPSFEVLCFRLFVSKSEFADIVDTDEMEQATWWKIAEIPYKDATQMKPGDELFVPSIIAGTPVKGYIWFEKENNELLGHEVLPCTPESLVA